MADQGGRVKLNDLDPQQLTGLRERLNGDMERFSQSAQVLAKTAQTFDNAGECIAALAESKEGALRSKLVTLAGILAGN